MQKILFISQKRKDAIGVVDTSVKKELEKRKHTFDFLEIDNKWQSRPSIMYHYCKNIYTIIKKTRKYKKIYFSRENPYVIFVKFCYPAKKIYMCVHHVEAYRGQSLIGKLIIKSVDIYIAISQYTKEQLMEIGVQDKNIMVNYNGISDTYYPEKKEQFQKFPYILYVWTEIPRKNTDALLNVFANIHEQYPQIKLVKIGHAWSEKAKRNFDKKIQELHIENSVIIKREFMSEEELRKWYSNAECYVSLSKLEWFWLTIPEAMACWCSVIASNIGSFREICWNNYWLVDLDSYKGIVNEFRKILSNKELKKEKIAKGLQRAQKFNRKSNVQNLILYTTTI